MRKCSSSRSGAAERDGQKQRRRSHFRCGIASAGLEFLTSRFISRQVASSLYVGENVCILTHRARSAGRKVDQSLLSCSRVRFSEARHRCKLSAASPVSPASAAPRQLAVTSQLGTLSARAPFEQNHKPMKRVVTAIIDCRNMRNLPGGVSHRFERLHLVNFVRSFFNCVTQYAASVALAAHKNHARCIAIARDIGNRLHIYVHL